MDTLRSGTEWMTVDDLSSSGSVRRAATRLADRLNFEPDRSAEVGIAASEIASNVYRHGGGGRVGLQIVLGESRPGVQIIAVDQGPGILDVAISSADGHSTRGTLGVGLGAIGRLADNLDLASEPGQGTVLVADFWPERNPQQRGLDVGGVTRPIAGEEVCGDAVAGKADDDRFVVGLFDGLGHGQLAAQSAQAAVDIFYDNTSNDPVVLLQAMHQGLTRTRGVAAAIASIDMAFTQATFAGVGNVSTFVDRDFRRHALLSQPGIIGSSQQLNMRRFDIELDARSLFLMHSDGVRENWDLGRTPVLRRRAATVVAAHLMRDFATRRDDASVLVLRRRQPR